MRIIMMTKKLITAVVFALCSATVVAPSSFFTKLISPFKTSPSNKGVESPAATSVASPAPAVSPKKVTVSDKVRTDALQAEADHLTSLIASLSSESRDKLTSQELEKNDSYSLRMLAEKVAALKKAEDDAKKPAAAAAQVESSPAAQTQSTLDLFTPPVSEADAARTAAFLSKDEEDEEGEEEVSVAAPVSTSADNHQEQPSTGDKPAAAPVASTKAVVDVALATEVAPGAVDSSATSAQSSEPATPVQPTPEDKPVAQAADLVAPKAPAGQNTTKTVESAGQPVPAEATASVEGKTWGTFLASPAGVATLTGVTCAALSAAFMLNVAFNYARLECDVDGTKEDFATYFSRQLLEPVTYNLNTVLRLVVPAAAVVGLGYAGIKYFMAKPAVAVSALAAAPAA